MQSRPKLAPEAETELREVRSAGDAEQTLFTPPMSLVLTTTTDESLLV